MTPLPQERRYTYADMLKWDGSIRYELYDGIPVALASPSDTHQRVLTALLLQIGGYLEGKRCRVYPAPFDVRLFESLGDDADDVDIVLQPDLMIVCDSSKVDRRGVHGAPDMVVEILSESTKRNDQLTKFNLYQRAGVQEYWIVDPDARTVAVHLLQNGQYGSPDIYLNGSFAPVSVLENCMVETSRVFQN